MQPKDPGDGWPNDRAIQTSILNHASAASATFFGRLEDQCDRLRELAGTGSINEFSSDANQNRGVTVMAACVHATFRSGCIGQSGLFENGQGIHVGAECNWFTFSSWNVRKHAGASSQSALEFHACSSKFPLDNITCAVFLVSKLRMLM